LEEAKGDEKGSEETKGSTSKKISFSDDKRPPKLPVAEQFKDKSFPEGEISPYRGE